MKIAIGMFALGFMVTLGPVMAIKDMISSKLKAERQVCTEIAADVVTGIVTRTDYMGTRCPARLLIEGNANAPHD